MSRLFNAFMLSSAAVLPMIVATPAMAQAGGSAASEFNTDIVVTARRVEERLQDVPISITVLNQQQIDDRNITSASGLATYTPSLVVNPNFGPDKASFAIRGFNQDLATSPTVGVYFAEVIAPRGVSSTLAGNGVGAGGLMDLQNVQVLKGPQGTLFGRNTTGGAILLVPQKPKDSFGGYVEGTYGNYQNIRVSGVLNVPLADTFKVRFAFDRNKRDGYLHNKSAVGPKAFQDVDYTTARLSVLANLSETLENYFIASYTYSHNNGGQPKMLYCGQPGQPLAGVAAVFAPLCRDMLARAAARGDGKFDVDTNNGFATAQYSQWQAINTTTWEASDNLTVKNLASYGEFRETSRSSVFGENFIYPATSPFAGKSIIFSIFTPPPGMRNSQQYTLTDELQLQGRSDDGNFTWQVGGYYEMSGPLGYQANRGPSLLACADYRTLNCSPTGLPGSFTSPFVKTKVHNNGTYAQATYKIGKFDLTGGIRYTWDKTRSYGSLIIFDVTAPGVFTTRCTNAILFPSGTVPGRGKTVTERGQCYESFQAKSNKPTWLLNAGYNFTDDVMAYAKYSRGYRQGFVNISSAGFETWQPDKLDNYEVGFKASFKGTVSGYLNVAAFKNNLTNQQVQATGVSKPGSGISSATAIINAGKSSLDGVEVEASAIYGNLKLDIGYAYLKTKLKSLTVPAIDPAAPYALLIPVSAVGSRLPFVPTHRVTATAIYNLPVPSSWGRMSVSGTWTYTGNVLQNAQSTFVGTAPATNLFNANINWKDVGGYPIDLSVFGTNLTNKRVQTNISGIISSFGFEGIRIGDPRFYGVRLRYKFGEN